MIRYIYIGFVSLVLLGCKQQDHELSFDIQRQVLSSCNSNPIDRLSIENDSIKSNNFAVEAGLLIYWNGDTNVKIPNELNLSNIPSGYIIRQGGRDYKGRKYIFKPNSSYTIEKYGSGRAGFYLRVWTDSLGRVFKTTHPKCGLKSLDNGEEMYQG